MPPAEATELLPQLKFAAREDGKRMAKAWRRAAMGADATPVAVKGRKRPREAATAGAEPDQQPVQGRRRRRGRRSDDEKAGSEVTIAADILLPAGAAAIKRDVAMMTRLATPPLQVPKRQARESDELQIQMLEQELERLEQQRDELGATRQGEGSAPEVVAAETAAPTGAEAEEAEREGDDGRGPAPAAVAALPRVAENDAREGQDKGQEGTVSSDPPRKNAMKHPPFLGGPSLRASDSKTDGASPRSPRSPLSPPQDIVAYQSKINRVVQPLPSLSVEVVVRHRAMLNQLGQVEVVAESQHVLKEEPAHKFVSPLKLLLLRNGEGQERPMMPSTNTAFLLDNADHKHGYSEPIRDRDKDWRELMWTTIAPSLSAGVGSEPGGRRAASADTGPPGVSRVALAMAAVAQAAAAQAALNASGEEAPAVEGTRKVFLDGVLMNKTLIMRQGLRLHDHGLVVSVFGMGMAGRVFMKKHRFPRHLRIEAYCPRLQEQFDLRIDMDEMEELMADKPELLHVGHKHELCQQLLCMLWFDKTARKLRISRPTAVVDHGLAADAGATRSAGEPADAEHIVRRARRQRAREERAKVLQVISERSRAGGAEQSAAASAAVSGGRGARPWLRLQGLVFAAARRLSGFYVVVTVHTQPRKPSTFVVRAYDPETCRYFEILVSTRELASIVHDRKDPELWDKARRKRNCRQLVESSLSLRVVGTHEMALAVRARQGLPRPGIMKASLKRRRALAQAQPALAQAESVAALQRLAASAGAARRSVAGRGRRGGLVLSRKVPRRDLGKGQLVFRGLRAVSSLRCLVSCYWNRKGLLVHAYELATSVSHVEHVAFGELETLCKDERDLINTVRRAPSRGAPETVALVDLVLRDRLVLLPEQVGTTAGALRLNRQIYCRGHKLRDTRAGAAGAKAAAAAAYCVVSAEQGPDWIRFTVFDRATCKRLPFAFPAEDTRAMIDEFAGLSPLEREVQLTVLVAGLCLDTREARGGGRETFVRALDQRGTTGEAT